MMCKEMLETRLMLKRAMKKHKGAGGSESVLQKVLDARQLAVKLLSNVTCKPMSTVPIIKTIDIKILSSDILLVFRMRFDGISLL